MCLEVYLASKRQLPLVPWQDERPAFYVQTASQEGNLVDVFEESDFAYSVGSFMGCACGLICDESFKQDEPETYEQRVRDMQLLKGYLAKHLPHNQLRLFVTNWTDFPDMYPKADFSLSAFDATASEIPEDTILTVTA